MARLSAPDGKSFRALELHFAKVPPNGTTTVPDEFALSTRRLSTAPRGGHQDADMSHGDKKPRPSELDHQQDVTEDDESASNHCSNSLTIRSRPFHCNRRRGLAREVFGPTQAVLRYDESS